MKKTRLLCAAAAMFAAPLAVQAQQITSQIEGQVTDEAGAPIGGASVVITDTRTGASRTIQSGAEGRFTATGLTVGGPYTVTATAPGYQGQTVGDLGISLQGATSLQFNLASVSAGAENVIVVTGQRANVQLRAIGPGTSFGQAVLQEAPTFNRDVRDIIRIDPRVSLDRDDGGSGQDRISCLGGNDRGNAFTVDGISQGDVYGLNDTGFSSRSSTPLPYDAIREAQVQFAPFDVDFGQFTGCAINVVTRGGTNEFHGTAFFEYSNSDLRGTSVAGRPVAPIEPEKRWGVSLGGPIIRDRLFFFGAYEHQEAGQSQDDGPAGAGYPNELAGVPVAEFNRISEILSRVYGIETGPLVRSRPFANDRYFGRLDWQINDDHRLEGTYQRLEEGTVRPDDFFNSQNSPQVTGLNTFLTSGTISNYYSGRLYSTWSDTFSTELRYSRSEVIDRQDPIGGGEAQSDNPIPRIVVGIDNPGTIVNGAVLAGPGNSRSANDLQTLVEQYRAVANISAGAHQFKIGAELNRADIFNLFVQNATGTLTFRNADALEQGLLNTGSSTTTTPNNLVGNVSAGAFGNFSRTGDVTDAAANFIRSVYSIYAQDEWTVNDRLDVTLGLRVDWYDGDQPDVNPNFARRYGFGNTTGFSNLDPVVMPRFGFTYDLDDFAVFSRTQVRGGVGIFSGGDPLVWFGNAFQNNGFGFAEGTTRSPGCPPGQIDVVVNGQFTGVPTCFQAAAQATAAAGGGDTQSVDPNITVPTVLRANFGIRTQFNLGEGFLSGWNIDLDYIYSQYENPYTLVDLAQTPDITRGRSGFTADGRPIYQSIEPTRAGCTARLVDVTPTPIYTGVNAACFGTSRDDELMLTNAEGFRSHIASFILSKNFDGGVFTPGGSVYFNFGYAYTDAQDRRNMYNSTAGSNYDLTAAADRQNPAASRGFFESRHNITLATTFREEFFENLTTSLGFTFVARSGRPYSLTFTGGGVFGDSVSGNDNALVYVPTGPNDPNISPLSNPNAVSQLVGFLNGLPCARGYAGRTIERNTCTNDWYYDLDLSFSQELPGPGRLLGIGGMNDSLRVFAMFDNFLNFLDDEWNVQRRRNFAGLQDVAGLDTTQGRQGVDSQGRYIINTFTGGTFDDDNQVNTSSSVWRVKVGVGYRF
ncbi:MAG: hypothetical protein JWL74_415 [Alphaproteobacteria bacterium]|nr:hypothetical protein [Alphaproteobacteria bacterium]